MPCLPRHDMVVALVCMVFAAQPSEHVTGVLLAMLSIQPVPVCTVIGWLPLAISSVHRLLLAATPLATLEQSLVHACALDCDSKTVLVLVTRPRPIAALCTDSVTTGQCCCKVVAAARRLTP